MTKIINGIEINYDYRNNSDNDTLVVLLHGWGSNLKLFDSCMTVIEKKYPVVALDMPGFGESSEPNEPWSVDNFADFVLDFIKCFDYKKIILLGHSHGGRVIIKILTEKEFDFKVEKVILVDSAGIKPKKTVKQKFRQRIFKIGKAFLNIPLIKKMSPDALNNWRGKFGSADYNSASETMRVSLIKVVNEDLTPNLSKIKENTLLIWGEDDTATPLSDGKLMEKLIPNSGLVTLKKAGHYSFLDQQFTFNNVIKSFLNIN
ncbi:MAG: alpha/beta hydrolase [Clostridiales bacterium]|nr:alpha/beta hydrolase [Clostridiales bacterium]